MIWWGLVVIAYLAIGYSLVRVFRDELKSDPDFALATLLFWPFVLVMVALIAAVYVVGNWLTRK